MYPLGFASSEQMGRMVVKCGLARVNSVPVVNERADVGPGDIISVNMAFYLYWTLRKLSIFMRKYISYPNTQKAFKHEAFEWAVRVMRGGAVLTEYKKTALSSNTAMTKATRILGQLRNLSSSRTRPQEARFEPDRALSKRDRERGAIYVRPSYDFSMLQDIDYGSVVLKRHVEPRSTNAAGIAKRILTGFLRAHDGSVVPRSYTGRPFMVKYGNTVILRRVPSSPEELFTYGSAAKKSTYNPAFFGMVYNHRYYY